MKRLLCLLLALALVCTLLPGTVAQAKTGGKLVALTFDDGPSSTYTKQLLDGLKERGVPVTFFMLGENTTSKGSLIKRAYEEGHEIATHTWDHSYLTKLSTAEIQSQMKKSITELEKACGKGADFLVRPPYGSTNQKVLDALDCPIIHWSVDSRDWELLNSSKVRTKIVNDAYDGAIILCHDIHKTTIPAALGAIDDLMDMGYEFVTVSELFRRRGRELELHKVHYNSNKNGTDTGPIPAPEIQCTLSNGRPLVTITCKDKNVPIYYTLDGSYPNQEAKRYTGPFYVDYFTEVTAVAAYKLNGSRSKLTYLTEAEYPVLAPEITLDSSGALVLKTGTPGAKIYYTLDGSKPDKGDILYSGPVTVKGDCFLRALAVHSTAGSSGESSGYLSAGGDLYYDIYAGQWFYEAMDWMHRMGILNGVAAYTMDPSGTLTRGMLAALLYRFSGETLEANWKRTNAFADVNQSFYYAEAIEWVYRTGVAEGYSSTQFGPDDIVTREQMCKMVDSFLNYLEMPLKKGASCADVFGDYGKIAPWALEAVEAMVSAGLIKGSEGNMLPADGATRAQFCVLLVRVRDYIDAYEFPEESSEPSVPTEPEEHTCTWMVNKPDVSIRVGESYQLYLVCSYPGCHVKPECTWTAETEGVVTIDKTTVTGLLAGAKTWLHTTCDGQNYQAIARIYKVDAATGQFVLSES